MQTAHELYIHELTDMLSAERQLVDALAEQAENATNAQLKKAIESHRAQTEKQVERLLKCFAEIGEEAEETECKGIKGLIEEYKAFATEEDPSADILDHFTCEAAAKVEQYEIKAYEGLIELAESMDHDQAVRLLNQSLKEEQATLEKIEKFGEKLLPENLGMEEMEEEEMAPARKSASKSRSKTRSRKAA